MSKISLVINDADWTIAHASRNEDLLGKYFNIEIYDSKKTYNKQRTIFLTSVLNANTWAKNLANSGFKVAIDNLFESPVSTDLYSLCNKNWFWYNQCFINHELGYINYVPNRTYSKLALMPIRLQKPHRDVLVASLENYLERMMYSYVEKGIYLPDDIPHDLDTINNFQLNFNPEWYDHTCFSIVAETTADSNLPLFVTEKTFKPIGFSHPFIICGQSGTLKFLKELGFETFENLFDESYDEQSNLNDKLQIIVDNVSQFKQTEYDVLTNEKIQHNKNLLNNKELVTSRIIDEIILPLLNYAET